MLRRQVKAPGLSRAGRVVLAALAGLLPGRQFRRLRLIVFPRVLLCWHAGLVRCRRAYPCRPGRPRTAPSVRELVREMARGGLSRGCRRIRGGLAGLGCRLALSAAWRVLKDAGAGPAPARPGITWRAFGQARARAILAAGFFRAGTVFLCRLHVLFVTGHGTRRVRLPGDTARPAGQLR